MTTATPKKHKITLGALLRFAVPLVISAGLCWLLFRDFDFAQMWQVIRTECHFGWIGGALALNVLAQVFRALRWRIQLRAIGVYPPLFAIVLSIFGTYAVNLVFPRLGEVWRTGYIAKRQDAAFATVFGSMVADRLADTVSVALIGVFAFILASGSILEYLAQNSDAWASARGLLLSPWVWGGVALCIAAAWWLLRYPTSNAAVLKVRRALAQLWGGFAAIFTMPGKGMWLLFTVGIWASYYSQFYLSLYAFDFTAGLIHTHGWVVALVAFVLSSISMGVPSNGGIGPWQWAVMFSLGIYGLDSYQGGVFANLQLGCTTLLTIALGLFTFACIALGRSGPRRAPREAAGPASSSESKSKTTDIQE